MLVKEKMMKYLVIILVYVESLVILGSREEGMKCVKDKQRSMFKLTDLRENVYYLGVSFERTGSLMSLHQTAY